MKTFNFKGDIAINGKSVQDSVDNLNKRLSNLELTYSNDYFIIDSTAAYQKIVPNNILPAAEIETVDSTVTEIKSLAGNLICTDDITINNINNSLTITSQGDGIFRFDGYNAWHDSHYDETSPTGYRYDKFLVMTLKPGIYRYNYSIVSQGTDDGQSSYNSSLLINDQIFTSSVFFLEEESEVAIGLAIMGETTGFEALRVKYTLRELEETANQFNKFAPAGNSTLIDNKGLIINIGTTYGVNVLVARGTLPAGTYEFGYFSSQEEPKNYYMEIGKINNGSGGSSITLDQEEEIGIYAKSGADSVDNYPVYLWVAEKDSTKAIDILKAPFEGNNFILTEPTGTLVFENPGKQAVLSKVVYMTKGE